MDPQIWGPPGKPPVPWALPAWSFTLAHSPTQPPTAAPGHTDGETGIRRGGGGTSPRALSSFKSSLPRDGSAPLTSVPPLVLGAWAGAGSVSPGLEATELSDHGRGRLSKPRAGPARPLIPHAPHGVGPAPAPAPCVSRQQRSRRPPSRGDVKAPRADPWPGGQEKARWEMALTAAPSPRPPAALGLQLSATGAPAGFPWAVLGQGCPLGLG